MGGVERIHLLHFADAHIGIENYGGLDRATGINRRVRDFLDRLDEMIAYALTHGVDVVIFGGDAYKDPAPSPTHQRAFAKRVMQLASAGVPVVLLLGDHDLPGRLERASALEIFGTLGVANVILAETDDVHTIQTRKGPVQVATIPYPVRRSLLQQADLRELSGKELDGALQRTIAKRIDSLKGALDPDVPAVLAAHLGVAGATEGSERRLVFGRGSVVRKSALDDGAWDYVALGHVHKHQNLNGEGYPAIVYPGSLERMDFDEEHDPKGFCWVELARGRTTWQFVELDARPFVTIQADVREAEDPARALDAEIERHDVRGAVVRLIVRLHADQVPRIPDLTARPTLADAFVVQSVNRRIDRPARARLGKQKPQEMTDQELLAAYLEIKETPPERAQSLLAHAEAIIGQEEGT